MTAAPALRRHRGETQSAAPENEHIASQLARCATVASVDASPAQAGVAPALGQDPLMMLPLRPKLKLVEAVDRALAGDWERAHLIVQDHEGDPIATGSTPSCIEWRAIWVTPVAGTAAVATRRARRSPR